MIPSNTVHLFVKAVDPAVRRALLTLAFDAGYKWSGQEALRYGLQLPEDSMRHVNWLAFNRVYTSPFTATTVRRRCLHYETSAYPVVGFYRDGLVHIVDDSINLNDFVSWLHDTI